MTEHAEGPTRGHVATRGEVTEHAEGSTHSAVTELGGVISTHLTALGASTRDRTVFAILTANPQFVEDLPVTRDNGEVTIDIANTVDGILLRFRDGELDSVRVMLRREGPFFPYPRPAELIDGLDLAAATPAQVRDRLGDPVAESDDALRFAVDGGVLTVDVAGDQVLAVTTSRA